MAFSYSAYGHPTRNPGRRQPAALTISSAQQQPARNASTCNHPTTDNDLAL
jgi:hypothetical protein